MTYPPDANDDTITYFCSIYVVCDIFQTVKITFHYTHFFSKLAEIRVNEAKVLSYLYASFKYFKCIYDISCRLPTLCFLADDFQASRDQEPLPMVNNR